MARTTKTTVNEVAHKEKVQPIKENKKKVLTANRDDMPQKPD